MVLDVIHYSITSEGASCLTLSVIVSLCIPPNIRIIRNERVQKHHKQKTPMNGSSGCQTKTVKLK